MERNEGELSSKDDQSSIFDNTDFRKFYEPKPMNPVSQIALLLGLTGGGLIVGTILSIVIFMLMGHVQFNDFDKVMQNPANINAIKVVQLVSTIAVFFLPAYFFGLIAHKKPLGYLALFLSGALGELSQLIPLSKSLEIKFKKMEDEYAEQIMLMAKMSSFKDYIIALIIIALVPAIVEETYFRGSMQQAFTAWFKNPWAAILVTSILFSAIHFSYYGFLSRAVLGMILGQLFYYSKNIWLNIFAHFLNNAIAVTSLYVYSLQGKLTKESLDDHFPIWLGTIAVGILVVLLQLFKKESDKLITDNNIYQ